MLFEFKIVVYFVLVNVLRRAMGDPPNFRVIAPEFVCPNDENAVIDKPDNTVITVKTDVTDLQLSWTVRWTHLDGPSQRFTLLLWRTVRALEDKLNGPQPEPFVYIIDNTELLKGVEYIFNVTATDLESENGTTKSFYIDNMKGDPKLMIEGRSDKFSVLLIGGEVVYTDMKYVMEAEVTTCSPTQDYYFVWSVQSGSASLFNVPDTSGSRLEIPPYSLRAGANYHVTCNVYRNNHEFITQTSLPFQVLYRGLQVSLNLDVLVVTRNNRFNIEAVIVNHDYYDENPKVEWTCIHENEPCENFVSVDDVILPLVNGLPFIGQYEIRVLVNVQDQHATSNTITIHVVEHSLPVIEIQPLPRIMNKHSIVTLIANASNVAPSCTLTWYFADEEYLASLDSNDTCEECQFGKSLSETVTVFSIEENFLNELADFTNETEWRHVTAEMKAATGRARFVAQCGCSLTFSCDTQGVAYGDVNFQLNDSPNVAEIKVTPETGTAMETVFRLSTQAASDPDGPLRYSFYCKLGTNDTQILGSSLENLAVETFLPYIDVVGTDIWVEVCDSLGTCVISNVTTIQLMAGEARTVQILVDSMRGHVRRCEMMALRKIVKSAITTYTNANQLEVLSIFTKDLFEALATSEENHCIRAHEDYPDLIDWLIRTGIDLSSFE